MSQIFPPTSDSKDLSLVSLLLSETDSSRMPSFGAGAIERTDAKPKLNDIYGVVRRYNLDLLSSCARAQQAERATVGFTISDEPETTSLTKAADECLAHLVRRAEEEFAPAGGTLSISKNTEMEEAGIHRFEERWRSKTHRQDVNAIRDIPVDLDLFWEHLKRKYGDGHGEKVAYQQVAQILVDYFGLNNDANIHRQKVGVVLKHRVYARKKDYGQNRGQFQIDSGESNRAAFIALKTFASWADLEILAQSLNPLSHGLCDYGFTYPTRNVVDFGSIKLTMYSGSWDFRFDVKTTQKLMLFLGEFASLTN